ncbi:MAG: T9SS type A sorting domain-containing protein [Ignavibacteriales bacterium]|nr:T9SS type A sorting domain-containing protein [Ignavibacteriales bacterium]
MKAFKFLFLFLVSSSLIHAQITITYSDVLAKSTVGNEQDYYVDTTTHCINIGNLGSTSWNFSTFTQDFHYDKSNIDCATSPYYSDYSGSAVCIYSTTSNPFSVENWTYQSLTTNMVNLHGMVSYTYFGPGVFSESKTHYTPLDHSMPIPCTYNTNWSHSGSSQTITENSVIGLDTSNTTYSFTSVCDAYGQMTLPGGITVDALRIKKDETSWRDGIYSRTISYFFLTKTNHMAVVTVDTTQPTTGTINVLNLAYAVPLSTNIWEISTQANEYKLFQNYPNPFNPSTNILFSVPKESLVEIRVFNLLGKEVTVLLNDTKSPGVYTIEFNAKNLPSGLYFAQMKAGNYTDTKKIILMK